MLDEIIIKAEVLAEELGVDTFEQAARKRKKFLYTEVIEHYAKDIIKQIKEGRTVKGMHFHDCAAYAEVSREVNPYDLSRQEAEEVFGRLIKEFKAAGYQVDANIRYSEGYKVYAYMCVRL